MPTTISLQRRRFELMAAEHALVIGARIAEARTAAGLSQRELADKIPGKSDGTQVSKWERGEHRVSDSTLEHIARVLKRDVAWFHTSPADKTETPDLSTNGQPDLEQIDAKLDQILETLKNAEPVEDVVTRALAPLLELVESLKPPTANEPQNPPADAQQTAS